MKAVKIFIVISILLSCLTAIAKAQENKTVSLRMNAEVILQLYCEDILVDNICDTWTEAHFIYHYKDGVIIWRIITINDVAQSEGGISYEITGCSKFWEWPVQEVHYNVKGEDGSHFVGILTYNNQTEQFTVGKALCVGINQK
jgi:hypothetical protein